MNKINFEKHVLPNGLQVILHEDHTLPVVSVNVWYHVGSKDEQLGKTGFAHLFEHIMFEGSKHHNRSHFDSLQVVGATLNGSTTTDRTNYWENLPSNHLELAIWLESDRMGFLLEALDQQRFDVQRDVVKNERRQSYENRPYGMASLRLQKETYPLPHPYHWPTIGFHEDLDAANLEDVKDFFLRYYIPNNASVSIAGDIEPKKTLELVNKYFSDLKPGMPVERIKYMDSPLQGSSELKLYDNVSLPRLTILWPSVPRFHKDEAPLALLAGILGDGKGSRLYRSLIYDKQIAQSTSSYMDAMEIAGDFLIDATSPDAKSFQETRSEIYKEIDKLISHPPSMHELERVKNRLEMQYSRQIANIGGFGGRANKLNSFNIFTGDPDQINTDMQRYLEVSDNDVKRVIDKYLGSRRIEMSVLPIESYSQKTFAIDRFAQPKPDPEPKYTPPQIHKESLKNGMDVYIVEKQDVSSVLCGLLIKGGSSIDPISQSGISSLTTSMLQEGTSTRTSEEIANEFEFMGSSLTSITSREYSLLGAEVLSKHFRESLSILSDITLNPSFPQHELDRIKAQRITQLKRIHDDPNSLSEILFPSIIYGENYKYGHSSIGTNQSLSLITQDNIKNHYRATFTPSNTSLIIVGNVSVTEVINLANQEFSNWRPDSLSIEDNNNSAKTLPEKIEIILADKPDASQSVIRAGHLTIPRSHKDYQPLMMLNQILGGQYTARLNMNLRQDKGYSYGYRSWVEWHNDISAIVAGGDVQTSATKESIFETINEFESLYTKNPVSSEELENAKSSVIQQFPSSFESLNQILERIITIVLFDLDINHYGNYINRIEKITLDDIQNAVTSHIKPDQLRILVIGDQKVIENDISQLGIPIEIIVP